MTVTERSRRRARMVRERLTRRFGDPAVVEKEWPHAPADYDRVRERFDAGTVGGAGVWVVRDDGRVLLVRNEGDEGWSDPGGKQEPGESLPETARREVREETGTIVELTGIHQAHVVRITDAGRDRPPVYRLIAIFAGAYRDGEVRPADGEIAAARWCDRHPDRLRYDELAALPIPAAD